MASVSDLQVVFERFAAFGSARNLATMASSSNSEALTLDNARFAKLARDTGIIDKIITPTEIDITFNRVKGKTDRRIDFATFVKAVRQLAVRKYPAAAEDEAFNKLVNVICVKSKGAPALVSTTAVKNDAVLDRLTDTTAYTGTHKHRFDDQGRGVGHAGHDHGRGTTTLSAIVARPAGLGNLKKRPSELTASEERLDAVASPRKSVNKSATGSSTSLNKASSYSTGSVNASKSSVFDRLTDSSGYTGAHKHRFNADGTGRGIAGRDSIPKNGVGVYRGGDVKELSQILRTR